MEQKRVCLIAGGGTLGLYTAQELLRMGHAVDILCLEEHHSDHPHLRFIRAQVDLPYLTEFLQKEHYDGIVNFIHYTSVEAYRPVHQLLCRHTGHLIFLSSYRVYADLQHPLTEEAPLLADTLRDPQFFAEETYALPKTRNERYIREESGTSNWTVVRPVISFSDKRLDIVTVSGHQVLERTRAGQVITLPQCTRDLTAGLDWAGNSGKLIAHLLFCPAAMGETFTVSSAQGLTWGEVAALYTDLMGARFAWGSVEAYIAENPWLQKDPFILRYDRLFDRAVDNRKILAATGLRREDFTPIREGIQRELDNLRAAGEWE